MPYIFCHREPDSHVEKMRSWFQEFFANFFSKNESPANAQQEVQEDSELRKFVDRFAVFCFMCYAIVIPCCLLYLYGKQHFALQVGRTTTVTWHHFSLCSCHFLSFCNFADVHGIFCPGCRPEAGWSDFVPLWSSWFDPKDITEGPRHTAFGGCNCRIHLSALSWPCTWDAVETYISLLNDGLPLTSDTLSNPQPCSYFYVPGSGSSCGWNCFRQTAWGMQRLRSQPGSGTWTSQFHPWRRCQATREAAESCQNLRESCEFDPNEWSE